MNRWNPRILIFVSLAALLAGPVRAESGWSYRYGDSTVTLTPDSSRAAVVLEPGLAEPLATLQAVVTSEPGLLPPDEGSRQRYTGLWFVEFDAALGSQSRAEILARVSARPGVRFATPVLRHGDALVMPKPELLVVFEPGRSLVEVMGALEGYDVLREFPALVPTFLVATGGLAADAFERARDLEAHPDVASVTPNFIQKLTPLNVPNDTLFSSQWAHQNTGQTGGTAGADMKSVLGWDVTTGSATIRVAVLDEGVDVDHEDLAANMLAGYDATDQASPEGVAGNAASTDGHGTACAGVVSAVGNNNLGVAGVNWNAKIIPIRLGYGSHWTEDAWTIDAITWAADNGADVLSNSWGGGPPVTAQENAIEYARVVGRNGLGCPVFFSSGNNNSSVIYPGAYPNTICVGATSPCDERKNPVSCDGENFWGSCFGSEVDIVAPGVLIQTTDIMGSGGYSSGNYHATFNGTSAAVPHAAGAAALILALAPNLRADEVQFLLEESADDQVGLPAEDTPGWDPYMGWGRINLQTLLDYDMVLRLGDAQATQGESGVDTFAYATNDLELAGFSFGVDFDESKLACTAVDLTGTVPGALGAEFVAVNFDNDPGEGWYTIGVVLDLTFPLNVFMFTGVDQPIAHAVFDVDSNASVGTTALQVPSSVGNPPITPVFASIHGGSHTPVALDGGIDIAAGGGGFIRGDANMDSGVNIGDAVYTLSFLFASGPQLCLDAMDSNDSGVVDVADAVYTLGFLFSGGAAPPPPYPNPGSDPTGDSLGCDNPL